MIRYGSITIDSARNAISVGGTEHIFMRSSSSRYRNGGCTTNLRFRLIKHLILTRGSTVKQLFSAIYDDDPEGGPIDGVHIFYVHLCHIKPLCAWLGLRLIAEKCPGGKTYRLEAS